MKKMGPFGTVCDELSILYPSWSLVVSPAVSNTAGGLQKLALDPPPYHKIGSRVETTRAVSNLQSQQGAAYI